MPNKWKQQTSGVKSRVKQRVSAKLNAWKARIAREISGGQTGGTSDGNKVDVYFEGDRAFAAMLDAIKEAKHYVHLEMYMFFSDHIGRRFADALSAKAREGIPVRVIYDSIGSLETDNMQWADMRSAGVTVVEYRPVAFWRKRSGIFGRNHRKNLIVDGATAFTGGLNLADPWAGEFTSDACWRDTHCRVIGPAAHDFNKLFMDSWEYCTKEKIFHRPDPKPLTDAEQTAHSEGLDESGCCRCVVVGSQGLRNSKEIHKMFSVNLARAEKSIKMTMPYFAPPKLLRTSLRDAAKRGIEVNLLLPRDSDVTVIDWVREGLYPQMLKWGVKVREYLGPVLHAKTMVVDDHIAVIGSSNFDILSVLMNRECGLVVFDDSVAEELDRQWQNDLMLSERVTRDWEGIRPWWRLLFAKLGCFLIRRF
ncbi:cardiolipin synthase B [Oceaniferula spumae]|uniref:Cardiolipin synthase B n=1 Tax=Oceaniferula spumae TaxID=2979115 RepID=A0AAT9FR38_9BACT